MRFRLLPPATALAAALTCVLVLSGCMPTDDIITPPPSPSTAPIFASDEEALAAATEAYAKYLEVSDQILADGGSNPERLLTVATRPLFDTQSTGFETARTENVHNVGRTTFDSVLLQQYDPSSTDGVGVIRLYLCVDLTNVDVVDENGQSVVSNSRPDRIPFEVTFDSVRDANGDELLVASQDKWGGRDFCV